MSTVNTRAKEHPAAAVLRAMIALDAVVIRVRNASHAGTCPACDAGEVWAKLPRSGQDVSLGDCPVCHGRATLDCAVKGCKRKECQ